MCTLRTVLILPQKCRSLCLTVCSTVCATSKDFWTFVIVLWIYSSCAKAFLSSYSKWLLPEIAAHTVIAAALRRFSASLTCLCTLGIHKLLQNGVGSPSPRHRQPGPASRLLQYRTAARLGLRHLVASCYTWESAFAFTLAAVTQSLAEVTREGSLRRR